MRTIISGRTELKASVLLNVRSLGAVSRLTPAHCETLTGLLKTQWVGTLLKGQSKTYNELQSFH